MKCLIGQTRGLDPGLLPANKHQGEHLLIILKIVLVLNLYILFYDIKTLVVEMCL